VFARLHTLSPSSRDTFWRSLKALGATRIVIALVLLLYFSAGELLLRQLSVQVCAIYLLAAAAMQWVVSRWRRHFMLQLMSQVACDLTCISLLYMAAGGMRSGLAILYLFPLAGCAILAPLVLALFSASLATLFMLAHSTFGAISGSESLVLQAGLYGIAWFAVVLVVNRMAARLIGQEELAAQRGIEVGVQQAVNRLVIAHSADGILVVGADGTIYMSNPAAQQMLGGAAQELQGQVLQPIAAAYETWRADPTQSSAFITIKPFDEPVQEEMTAAWNGC
jgi:two-component system sensor histidine kinase PilS (NtrC family)